MVTPVIGIDLGTTFSCVAVMKDDKPHMIEIKDGLKTMASIVSYTKNGRIVGDTAKENYRLDPTTTVHAVKRYIGRRYNELDTNRLKESYPIEIVNHNNSPRFKIEFNGETQLFTPEEISATILEKLKEAAEKYLDQEISQAVITVPAHFNDSQRQATIDAGKIAGLEVLRIINEPTAAALAYGIHEKYQETNEVCNVLIYDFGGGTFDVSIITIDNSVFEVKATNGDTQLGGDDLDQLLIEHFIKEFQDRYDKNLKQDRRAIRRLRLQCEKIKKQLSNSPEAILELDSLHEGHQFYTSLTKSQFEMLCVPLIERTLHLVEGALKDAQLNKSDIDEVVLVGGSSRIPRVREMVQEYFDGKELNMSENPDETVAMGAAIQAAILDKNFDSEVLGTLLLMDVNSLSLGLEVIGGAMSVIIPRNTQIPAEKKKQYETTFDYQTSVDISVYEGEREMVKENSFLGAFVMDGLTQLPRGKVTFEITFNINTDGILNVTATELNANKSTSLVVAMDKNRLDEEEIYELITKANEYRKADAKWKESTDAKVELLLYCQDLKHMVNEELSIQMETEEIQTVNLKCDDTLKWLIENDNQDKLFYKEKKKEVYNICSPILKLYV